MNKFILILFLFFVTLSTGATTLEAGISIENVPKALFGQWRISAKLENTNSYKSFKPQSIDFWNLSRNGNRVKLENPYSGANAELSIQTIENNLIVFSKKMPFDNKILTDTVTIRLQENEFKGYNHLTLETISSIDNKVLKTETATYEIKGEKISGDNILNFD